MLDITETNKTYEFNGSFCNLQTTATGIDGSLNLICSIKKYQMRLQFISLHSTFSNLFHYNNNIKQTHL